MSARDDVKSRIDAIEESYEFFLAYAAQGLSGAQASKTVGQIRTFLGKSCLLYTSPSPRDGLLSRMPSSA